MMKAAAPITGGVIWPPHDAQASTPAAKLFLYPPARMAAMVKVPVVTTLAAALPERVPMKALPTTAVLAAPPTCRPVRALAKSVKKRPAPDESSVAPKSTNRNTLPAETARGVVQMPSTVR